MKEYKVKERVKFIQAYYEESQSLMLKIREK